MKISEGLKLDGWRVEIPGAVRNDFPEFFKEMGYKVGVEIGTYTGLYTRILCSHGLKIYTVDPWLIYPGFLGLRHSSQERQERSFEKAKSRLAKYKNCTIIRKTSMEAVKDFEDESIDFVYIDGNHGFKYFTEDLWEWSKKIKKGGIISGHDYRNDDIQAFVCDVKHVLDGYIKAAKIPKWYILGKEGEGDRDRSWFFLKT